MEEEEGFEPPRGMTRLSVFKTDPFSQTWVFLRIKKLIERYFAFKKTLVIFLREKHW